MGKSNRDGDKFWAGGTRIVLRGGLLLCLINLSLYSWAHKDRVQQPTAIRFVFENLDTVTVAGANVEKLREFSLQAKSLIEVKVNFVSGFTVTLHHNGTSWREMKVNYRSKEFFVKRDYVEGFPSISFDTFRLLWDGSSYEPFTADYFLFQFSPVGKTDPRLQKRYQVIFDGAQLIKIVLWKPINLRSERRILLYGKD